MHKQNRKQKSVSLVRNILRFSRRTYTTTTEEQKCSSLLNLFFVCVKLAAITLDNKQKTGKCVYCLAYN